MKVFSSALLFLVGMSGALASVTVSNPDPANVFGVAHVDGRYFLTKEDFLDEGAEQILAIGTKVIKLYLTPKR